MRELISKLCEGRREIYNFLGDINMGELSRGRITVTPGMLENLLGVLTGGDPEIKVLGMNSEGRIKLSVKTGSSMELAYELHFDTLALERGRLYGLASYRESRSGGGVGGALLGLTGKSGLSFALSKYKWIKADNSKIELSLGGLPQGIFCALARVAPQGMTFRI